MGNEFKDAMTEMLKGSKPTTATQSIMIFAMDVDKKFDNVDKNFVSVNEKLDLIIHTIQTNNIDTNEKFKERDLLLNKAINDRKDDCAAHKIELEKKFKEIDNDVMPLTFFTKYPSILKIVGWATLIVIIYFSGRTALLEKLF
jgi:hypothetical protein